MLEFTDITNETYQSKRVLLTDGTFFDITIYFIPMQYKWVIISLTYDGFTIKNHRICNSPNMLHQFKNKLPFGLACFSDADREPMFIDDFSEGASKIYVLTEDEVTEYGEYLSNG